jgi:hypothetical protein
MLDTREDGRPRQYHRQGKGSPHVGRNMTYHPFYSREPLNSTNLHLDFNQVLEAASLQMFSGFLDRFLLQFKAATDEMFYRWLNVGQFGTG